MEAIDAFVLAGADKLQTEDGLPLAHEVIAGTAVPSQVVGKSVLIGAVPAEGELALGFKKERTITRRELDTENAIIRAGAKGEIVLFF